MKIEKAYCTDLDEIIDVETAYDLYWAERISDKHNFECIHEDCDAAITAANLDKLRQDMVYDPYYKVVDAEDHSISCPYRNEVETVSNNTKGGQVNTTRGKLDSDLADVFGFKRPPSHFEKRVSTSPVDETKNSSTNKKRKKIAFKAEENRPSTHYSLLSFVSKYSRHLKQGATTQKFISIDKSNVSYAEMFVEINGQCIKSLSDSSRVYFGKAYVNKIKNGDYTIRFVQSFEVNKQPVHTSIYLPQKVIENAFSRKMSERKFEELSKKKYPAVWAFVYAKPFRQDKDGKQYVNFKLGNMDLFDFREKFN